jgi:prevent-host-death family protein
MTKKVSTAKAKASFSEIVTAVSEHGERYIIERRGRPVAGVVSVGDLQKLERESPPGKRLGPLALVGAWPEIDEEEWDAIIKNIYRVRSEDLGRPVNLEP